MLSHILVQFVRVPALKSDLCVMLPLQSPNKNSDTAQAACHVHTAAGVH